MSSSARDLFDEVTLRHAPLHEHVAALEWARALESIRTQEAMLESLFERRAAGLATFLAIVGWRRIHACDTTSPTIVRSRDDSCGIVRKRDEIVARPDHLRAMVAGPDDPGGEGATRRGSEAGEQEWQAPARAQGAGSGYCRRGAARFRQALA
jgi:hypothetical protein